MEVLAISKNVRMSAQKMREVVRQIQGLPALQAKAAREAADTGDALARDLNKDFTAGLKVKVEEVINAWVLASQARGQYNEALYKEILGLAELKRVTAGTFNARLAETVAARPTPKQETEKREGDTKAR